jgi:hypothetical protein
MPDMSFTIKNRFSRRAVHVADRRAGAGPSLVRTLTDHHLRIKLSGDTGAPAEVVNKRRALTGAAPGLSSEAIVRDFLLKNGNLYGLSAADVADLVVLGDSPGGASGLRMLLRRRKTAI